MGKLIVILVQETAEGEVQHKGTAVFSLNEETFLDSEVGYLLDNSAMWKSVTNMPGCRVIRAIGTVGLGIVDWLTDEFIDSLQFFLEI